MIQRPRGHTARASYACREILGGASDQPLQLHPQCQRMFDLLARGKGKLDPPMIKGFFADHQSTICKHPGFKQAGSVEGSASRSIRCCSTARNGWPISAAVQAVPAAGRHSRSKGSEAEQKGRSAVKTEFWTIYWRCSLILMASFPVASGREAEPTASPLVVGWADGYLTIGGAFPGREIRVLYLEAYCRPGSTDRDWGETVIGHTTEMLESSADIDV